MSALRPYQIEAVEACYQYLREKDGAPVIVAPTGSGKSHLIAEIASDAVMRWNGRMIVLAHVQELLAQNADKIRKRAPDLPLGIYSAGLGRRDTLASVICAGIQSVYNNACELGHVDVALVDECHLIPTHNHGMYRSFLGDLRRINPAVRLVGVTATAYRLDSGPICGPDSVFTDICYEISVRELIRDGYLCPLVTKAGVERADFERLHLRGGEYVADEVEALMDQNRLVDGACREIGAYMHDRKACLIFASGVAHANHVAAVLRDKYGQACETIFGDTLPHVRQEAVEDFRGGRLKFLVNVGVLTTGFDAPITDCVAILRPTMSPGLLVQMAGRGFRLHPGKQNCLVLDFGGNILRHGPIDSIRAPLPGRKGSGSAPAKECPRCHSILAAGYAQCPDCGFEFEIERVSSRHEARAASEGILTGQVSEVCYPVLEVRYGVHAKRNAPPDAPRSMRVEYRIGFNQWQSEWICFEHSGFARQRAESWWQRRSNEPVPDNAEDAVALAQAGLLCETKAIVVRSVAGDEFDRIIEYELCEKPCEIPEPEYVPIEDDIPF